MRIDHISIYATNPEVQKTFYESYFGGRANREENEEDERAYFMTFDDGAKIEIINRRDIRGMKKNHIDLGYIRLAFGFESRDEVDQKVNELQEAGFQIKSYPKIDKNGLYKAVILDPDDNQVILSFDTKAQAHEPIE